MIATGIVRRVDDLGRIVIPKEIRHSLDIQVGEPLELYLDKNSDMICLHKYQTAEQREVGRILDDLPSIESMTKEEKDILEKLLNKYYDIKQQGE